MKTLWILKTPRMFITLAAVFLVLVSAGISSGKTAKDQYVEAEGRYKKLRNNAEMQKHRDHWIDCVKEFQAVYQMEPNGPWAAAALYMSGDLYRQMYLKFSHREDKKEALDAFERIIKRYPKSRYRDTALNGISAVSALKASGKVRISSSPDVDDEARTKFQTAKNCYDQLKASPEKQKYRSYWFNCLEKFDAVYRHDTSGPWAAAGLYRTGVLYEELSGISYRDDDREKALEIYQMVISDYPQSQYRQKAVDMRDRLCKSHPGCETTESTASDTGSYPVPPAGEDYRQKEQGPNRLSSEKAEIREIRCWSNPSYTRIVVDADRKVTYEPHLLKEDPSNNKPRRLYLDLGDSVLGKGIKTAIPVDDNLLSGIRAGQFTNELVRVVIDIKSFESYKIFHLQEPFRIVIDVWGVAQKKPVTAFKPKDPGKKGKVPSSALAKQLALGVSRIVIDPGHGGKDPGAMGYQRSVLEKDITLQIARKLSKKIKENLGCEVLLTRERDKYISLEARTAFANTQNADLFVSIHANAHESRNVYGLETFFLNLATDDDAIRLAARENATSTKNISDLHSILSDLMQNAKINESSRLAASVQDAMFRGLKNQYSHVKDNGVKQAPFYVLLGAQMPSILIETSFISNPRECKRLSDSQYQEHICDAIAKGIMQYVKEISPGKISTLKRKNGTTG